MRMPIASRSDDAIRRTRPPSLCCTTLSTALKSLMAWQRRNGRLVRGNESTLVALPQPSRRRRARSKPNRLKALPVDIAAQMCDFLSPLDALRVAATESTACEIMRSSFEHLNTCAVDVTQSLSLIRSYARVRAPLRSLTIHLGSQEVPMLRWLLETCDVTNLSRMRVKVVHGVPLYNLDAHLQLERTGNKAIDVDDEATFRRSTLQDFHRLVAWAPASLRRRPALHALRSLAIVAGDDEVLTQLGDALQSVEVLQVSLPRSHRSAHFPLASQLPQLRTLKLQGGAANSVSIESPSLRVIDLRAAGKHCFLRHLNCPSLTDLRVRDLGYGNGIRRMWRPPPEKLQEYVDDGDIGPTTFEVVKLKEDRPPPPQEWQDELDRLDRLDPPRTSLNANWMRISELQDLIRRHNRRVVISIPAAGNTWVAPDRRNNLLPCAHVTLPPTCTVHFGWEPEGARSSEFIYHH